MQGTNDESSVGIGKTALSIMGVILILLVLGSGAWYFILGPGTRTGETAPSGFKPTQAGVVPSVAETRVSTADVVPSVPETRVSSADVARLYQEFECPCCGKDIGSCDCGMAKERRGLIDEQVAQGGSESQVYRAMFQRYGAGAFFDEALAGEVRAEVLAELPADRPVLVVEPSELDLGTVPIDEGPIAATFTVRNAGQSDLTITGLQTTCGCTTAVLETSGGTSPVFGANLAENPSDWSAVVAPGEEASLVATFDLMFHGPEATGTFRRGIFVVSNDPLNSSVDVAFVVEVTPQNTE